MTEHDLDAFSERMEAEAISYGVEVGDPRIAIYFDRLQQYALEDLFRAFTAHSQDPDRGRHFPLIADLCAVFAAEAEARRPDEEEVAARARIEKTKREVEAEWADAERRTREYGPLARTLREEAERDARATRLREQRLRLFRLGLSETEVRDAGLPLDPEPWETLYRRIQITAARLLLGPDSPEEGVLDREPGDGTPGEDPR